MIVLVRAANAPIGHLNSAVAEAIRPGKDSASLYHSYTKDTAREVAGMRLKPYGHLPLPPR